jgi:hypothetical protein
MAAWADGRQLCFPPPFSRPRPFSSSRPQFFCFLGRSDRRLADLFGLLTIFDGRTAGLLFFQVLAGCVGAALFFAARGGPPAGCALTAPLYAHVLWAFRAAGKKSKETPAMTAPPINIPHEFLFTSPSIGLRNASRWTSSGVALTG